ncbi:uncharacterized protein LOC101845914 [Aplysia californica]|uniref:Uncharacterized protein LOC101845914 n=1 Tax=Aplysia californica TaxID=6500 RepID=A0ABM0JL66_APLCA|nr:uncharacterized protein LOC101845914 [Aplysia californica]XP_035825076.1 uncharacterized protein LOC101845914 [Aplysia californica]
MSSCVVVAWTNRGARIISHAFLVNIVVFFIIWGCLQRHVDCQTHHYPMRHPHCNNFYRHVPAAVLEGAGDHRISPGVCDVTLSTPGRAVWMLRIERAVILDCSVKVQVFDTHMSPANGKPVLVHGCASADPGIRYINSSTLTVRLRHSNATDYSFTVVVTARKIRTRPDVACGGFQCDNGACVAKSLMCDTVDNCFDYSDESFNSSARCNGGFWPFKGENWGVLASVLGAGVVLGVTAACCRHIRQRRRSSLDDLYDLNEGPYVHKYAYRYAVIRPPKKPNKTNVVLGRDGHMHYNATHV